MNIKILFKLFNSVLLKDSYGDDGDNEVHVILDKYLERKAFLRVIYWED
jgi:hypothetical protein